MQMVPYGPQKDSMWTAYIPQSAYLRLSIFGLECNIDQHGICLSLWWDLKLVAVEGLNEVSASVPGFEGNIY